MKVDNTVGGRPWDGVEFADVVYVEPVEGGLTRLLAVFSSELPVSVGPVRSARETDVGVLGAYGLPALVYSGAAPPVVRAVTSAPVVSTVPHDVPGAFRRDGDRRSYPARWSRTSSTDPTRLTSPDGREVPLAPGRVWVLLAPSA